jgi:hypothetical protein
VRQFRDSLPKYNFKPRNKQQPGSSPPKPGCSSEKFEAGDPAKEADQLALSGAEVLNHMLGYKRF